VSLQILSGRGATNMPIKQSDGLYELPAGEEEQTAAAAKHNIRIDDFLTDNEFESEQVTVGGESFHDEGKQFYGSGPKRTQFWKERGSEEIKGLSCPDCHAQAFKTDQKMVAVCGDYPGWYFFYRRTDLDKSQSSKISIKVINGVPTYVDESGNAINKNK
jgi:hypothetical protein